RARGGVSADDETAGRAACAAALVTGRPRGAWPAGPKGSAADPGRCMAPQPGESGSAARSGGCMAPQPGESGSAAGSGGCVAPQAGPNGNAVSAGRCMAPQPGESGSAAGPAPGGPAADWSGGSFTKGGGPLSNMTSLSATRATLPRERLVHMYRQMRRIRHFEEAVDRLFQQGLIWGTFHLYIGQEASAVGAVEALRPDDYITSTHRGHGHCIAKGASIPLMMAELRGKETGYCRGRGGSMHIADLDTGNLGANGIVGGGVPIAAGAALAIKKKGTDQVVMCFFGDGAMQQGAFHEAVNFASVFKLPVVFLCENNQYAMSMPVEKGLGSNDIAARAASYGIPGVSADGND